MLAQTRQVKVKNIENAKYDGEWELEMHGMTCFSRSKRMSSMSISS